MMTSATILASSEAQVRHAQETQLRCAFTLCSNNYLAQAKTLGDSLIRCNPGYRFVIGLVDRLDEEIDYTLFFPHRVIAVEDIGIKGFDDLWKKYDIIELKTAVKPFFFQFLFRKYPDAASVIYLDPDIMVFSDFLSIEEELRASPTVIVPHALTAVPFDGCDPQDKVFLRYGIYNLGFVAATNTTESRRLLEWWAERTYNECWRDPGSGVFVDQLWMNLAPVFFDVAVSRNPGLDVAYWNLHERVLSIENGAYIVNNHYPLVFYHFSAYNPLVPSLISVLQNRYSFASRPDLVDLYGLYNNALHANKYEHYRKLVCHFTTERETYLDAANEGKENQDLVGAGFRAHRRGDLYTARRYFLGSILRNPLVLRNTGILSIIMESFLGSARMRRYRQWRHPGSRTY